jgi:hypothetical protein
MTIDGLERVGCAQSDGGDDWVGDVEAKEANSAGGGEGGGTASRCRKDKMQHWRMHGRKITLMFAKSTFMKEGNTFSDEIHKIYAELRKKGGRGSPAREQPGEKGLYFIL